MVALVTYTTAYSTGSNTITVARPGDADSSNTIIVTVITYFATKSNAVLFGTRPTGFSNITGSSNYTFGSGYIQTIAYYKYGTSSEPSTYDWTLGGSDGAPTAASSIIGTATYKFAEYNPTTPIGESGNNLQYSIGFSLFYVPNTMMFYPKFKNSILIASMLGITSSASNDLDTIDLPSGFTLTQAQDQTNTYYTRSIFGYMSSPPPMVRQTLSDSCMSSISATVSLVIEVSGEPFSTSRTMIIGAGL